MDWLNNICWLSDSYKISHWKQYPPLTRTIYSYFEARRGAFFPKVTFFGLQYLLKNYLAGPVVTKEKIDEAEELFYEHFFQKRVFNRQGWDYILNKHGGYLPVKIKAVAEGVEVPASNVLMTVENTGDGLQTYWLTNYLETLLTQVWYPSTVATQSKAMRAVLMRYLELTGDPGLIDFKLHDFGFRGVTCPEQAAIGGAAHLINFRGTDTTPGLIMARRFYNERMAGHSIAAAEHSTISSWGRENEVKAMQNMLEAYPDGLVACVSDTYDIFKACEMWGTTLKEKVLSRDGVLVVRPDSGDPPVIVGQVLEILGKHFGFTVNEKGYRVLHPKVRVIQGDGIDFAMLDRILTEMEKNKWSADNIAFGSGGGLLQKLNRDTERFAFKCSEITVEENGVEITRDVYKDPVTDPGKVSKMGKLALVKDHNGQFATIRAGTNVENYLQTVFEDGELKINYSFADIRKNTGMVA